MTEGQEHIESTLSEILILHPVIKWKNPEEGGISSFTIEFPTQTESGFLSGGCYLDEGVATVHIGNILIPSELRKKGIGTRLMRALEQICQSTNVKYIKGGIISADSLKLINQIFADSTKYFEFPDCLGEIDFQGALAILGKAPNSFDEIRIYAVTDLSKHIFQNSKQSEKFGIEGQSPIF